MVGGGCGGSSAFRYFSQWNCRCGLLVRNRPVGKTTINQHAAAYRKGVSYTFCLEEAISLQDCRCVIAICLAEVEKYHRVMWVSTMWRCREGKNKKLANIAALPRGGGMPLRWGIYWFPWTERDIAEGWGEGALQIWGFWGRRELAGKVASDVELRGFLFFGLMIKKAGRLNSLTTMVAYATTFLTSFVFR